MENIKKIQTNVNVFRANVLLKNCKLCFISELIPLLLQFAILLRTKKVRRYSKENQKIIKIL